MGIFNALITLMIILGVLVLGGAGYLMWRMIDIAKNKPESYANHEKVKKYAYLAIACTVLGAFILIMTVGLATNMA